MKITYLGHSTFEIQTQSANILIDPFITPNPNASHINISTLKPDYILITHGHADHLADAEAIAKTSGATIISNFEIATWYKNKDHKTHGMAHGGKFRFPFGTVKLVQADHTSGLPDGSYGGVAGGFVITANNKTIYIAGDTGLTMNMKLIPLTNPKLDLAILPIGDNFTMGYEDANIAADFVECNQVLGCHYNTFPPITINLDDAKSHFSSNGKTLHILDIGSALNV